MSTQLLESGVFRPARCSIEHVVKEKVLINDSLSRHVSVITVNTQLRNVLTCDAFDSTLGEGERPYIGYVGISSLKWYPF